MDEPARKRRRTGSPGGSERASSPLKMPPRRRISVSPTKSKPRRPSFASPTKASLARFNPNLLPSESAPRRKPSNGPSIGRGKQQERLAQNEEEQATAGARKQGASKDRNNAPRPGEESAYEREGVPQDTELSPPHFRQAERSKGAEKQTEGGAEEIKQPPDPELEAKKREKEALLRELQELEDDVAECADGIQKLQEQSATQVLDPSSRDDLISLINRINNSAALREEEQVLPVSNLLCSFLPFTAQIVAPPKPKQNQETPIPSHNPLELEDPLPYLEMFTSFKFTSSISLPEPSDHFNDLATRQLHQTHTIDITGPHKLLSATVQATINTLTHSIIDLQIPRLSTWADRELGTFIYKQLPKQDLSCVSWAMNSYWDLAKKRAEYWHKCETSFAHLIPGRTSEDTENDVRHLGSGKPGKGMSRKELARNLGRDILVLESRHVLLKISWKIGFDWTGEAGSEIWVEPAYPRVWSEADGNASLKKIPQTFDSLVQSKGVFEATRIMVALLFSE